MWIVVDVGGGDIILMNNSREFSADHATKEKLAVGTAVLPQQKEAMSCVFSAAVVDLLTAIVVLHREFKL